MLIPHVSIVGDRNSVLIDLSLVVDDSGSELSSGSLKDLPASRVGPSSYDSLFLKLINDPSLPIVMMTTTSGSSDNSSCGSCAAT